MRGIDTDSIAVNNGFAMALCKIVTMYELVSDTTYL